MSTILCEYVSDLKKYNLQFIASNSKDCFSSSFIIKPPTDFEYIPVSIYDGFVFAVIFKAMEVGEDFIVELPLSIDGVRNIHYFIEAWANLCPNKYKKIHFIATNIVSLNNKLPSSEAIVAFSGGVDSCFTLIRHNEKDWQHNDAFSLKHVLCIQGFDVPTDKSNEYAKLMERISPIYEQFGCKRSGLILRRNLSKIGK